MSAYVTIEGRTDTAVVEVGVVGPQGPSGGGGVDPRSLPFNATGDGIADDAAAIDAADIATQAITGPLHFSRGNYRVSSDLTIVSDVDMATGAVLVPDAGVTITLNGDFRGSQSQHFDTSAAGSSIVFEGITQTWPEWWGAVGDATADDAPAINEAIDALRLGVGFGEVLLQRPLYLVDTTLYYDGAVSVRQRLGSEIRVRDADPAKGGWIVHTAVGTRERWTGQEIDVTRRAHGSINPNLSHVVNVFDAQDYKFTRGKFFDFNSTNISAHIKGTSNNAWKTVTGTVRKRGYYMFNIIECSQPTVGGEGISVGPTDVPAEKMFVIGNEIQGTGDDPIGLHGVTTFEVALNICNSVDGRIYVEDSVDGTISDNNLKHSSVLGGTSFIYLTPSGAGSASRACSDITITNNKMTATVGQTDTTYGIRILGGQEITIGGNTFRNKSGHVANAVAIEKVVAGSTTYKPGWITVLPNYIYGGRVKWDSAANRDGPVCVLAQRIDGAGIIGAVYDASGTTSLSGDEWHAGAVFNLASAQAYDAPGNVAKGDRLLGTWTLTNAGNSGSANMKISDDITSAVLNRGFCITRVVIRADSPPAAGQSFDVRIRNITLGTTLWTLNVTSGDSVFYSVGGVNLARDVLPVGQAIGVILNQNAQTNLRDVQVTIWGIDING